MRYIGPCTYRLFLFRLTFDKTKKGNQTVLYRFSFFILSNKNQNTKNKTNYRLSFFILSNITRNTKGFSFHKHLFPFIIARYEIWNTIAHTVYRKPYIKQKTKTEWRCGRFKEGIILLSVAVCEDLPPFVTKLPYTFCQQWRPTCFLTIRRAIQFGKKTWILRK